MLIRKAKADETEQIGDVDVASFLNSPYGEKKGLAQNKEAQQIRWNHAESFCHEHPDWVYVAVEDDKVVGIVTRNDIIGAVARLDVDLMKLKTKGK